jgi:hypothetical protein
MFCDRCGAQVEGPARFCPACGRNLAPAPIEAPPVAGGRVVRHLRTLGILWLVYSGLHLLQALVMTSFATYDWWFFDRMPFFVPGLIRAVGGFYMVVSLVGLLAGWGLLERRPWARLLAMILAVIALLKVPLGTALGIYTLWVLAPAQSEREYRSVERAA